MHAIIMPSFFTDINKFGENNGSAADPLFSPTAAVVAPRGNFWNFRSKIWSRARGLGNGEAAQPHMSQQ